jgi:hypothetical protein
MLPVVGWVAPNQMFTSRRLYAGGVLSVVGAGEKVAPAYTEGMAV